MAYLHGGCKGRAAGPESGSKLSAPINMPGRSASGNLQVVELQHNAARPARIDAVRGDVHHQPQTRQ